MSRQILIGGTDRFGDYIGGSLEVRAALSYAMDTCIFRVRGAEPSWGQDVVIEDEGVRLFAGIALKPTMTWEPVGEVPIWTVDCDDFTALLNAKLVTERYMGVTATEAFLDLVERYAPAGFTVDGVLECDQVIEYLDLTSKPLGDALTAVCEYVGWQWFPDYYKDLHFYDLAAGIPAPFTLTPGGRFTNFSRTIDAQAVRNRIHVEGGKGQSAFPITATFTGDGAKREWLLPAVPRELHSLTVNGVAKTVGWDGVDEATAYQFMVNANSGWIKASDGTTTPAAGHAIVLVYVPEIPILVTVDDLVSQAAMAAILGTDGILEDTMVDNSLTDVAQASAAGYAELRKFANPRESVTFDSISTGWRPGQTVPVLLPDRHVSGDFIVQEVMVTWPTADHTNTNVKAGGALFGLADFISDLSKKAKQTTPEEQPTMNKLLPVVDSITLSDSVSTATSTEDGTEVGTALVGLAELTG